MRPTAIWLYAIIRRILTIAASGILTYIIANWQGWVTQGVQGDATALRLWPVLLLIIEAVQKAVRVRNR